MRDDIKTFLERAKSYYHRMNAEYTRDMKLSLAVADCIYNLRRIKISVAYRKTDQDLSGEDKDAIREIRSLCETAEVIWAELHDHSDTEDKLK